MTSEDRHVVVTPSEPAGSEGTESESIELSWGVHEVPRSSPLIEAFLGAVPSLCQQENTFGLLWDKALRPSFQRYSLGSHYCSTREDAQASPHARVTFHRDGETGVKFAIKTLVSWEGFNSLEVKVGLLESHPHICQVYGVIVRGGHVNLFLEHAGSPIMRERSWLCATPERKLLAAHQCFQALDFLAKHSLVHCDVKPDNLTVVRQDDQLTIKLIDFGSCQRQGTPLPLTALTMREYWAPEMWASRETGTPVSCEPGLDVYAMALTLYFLETSQHLTQRIQDIETVMLSMPGMVKMLALPDSLPADLRLLMAQCLDQSDDQRPSAARVCARLQDASLPAFIQCIPPVESQASWQHLLHHSRVMPAPLDPAALTSVERLKESFTSVSLSDGQAALPSPLQSMGSISPRGKLASFLSPCGKLGKGVCKSALKAKELKQGRAPMMKGKGKGLLMAETAASPVHIGKEPPAAEMLQVQSSETLVMQTPSRSPEVDYPMSSCLKHLALKVMHTPQSPVELTENQKIPSDTPTVFQSPQTLNSNPQMMQTRFDNHQTLLTPHSYFDPPQESQHFSRELFQSDESTELFKDFCDGEHNSSSHQQCISISPSNLCTVEAVDSFDSPEMNPSARLSVNPQAAEKGISTFPDTPMCLESSISESPLPMTRQNSLHALKDNRLACTNTVFADEEVSLRIESSSTDFGTSKTSHYPVHSEKGNMVKNTASMVVSKGGKNESRGSMKMTAENSKTSMISLEGDNLDVEMIEDDLGFVFDALDAQALTGADDDITDYLFSNLPDTDTLSVFEASSSDQTLVGTSKPPTDKIIDCQDNIDTNKQDKPVKYGYILNGRNSKVNSKAKNTKSENYSHKTSLSNKATYNKSRMYSLKDNTSALRAHKMRSSQQTYCVNTTHSRPVSQHGAYQILSVQPDTSQTVASSVQQSVDSDMSIVYRIDSSPEPEKEETMTQLPDFTQI